MKKCFALKFYMFSIFGMRLAFKQVNFTRKGIKVYRENTDLFDLWL